MNEQQIRIANRNFNTKVFDNNPMRMIRVWMLFRLDFWIQWWPLLRNTMCCVQVKCFCMKWRLKTVTWKSIISIIIFWGKNYIHWSITILDRLWANFVLLFDNSVVGEETYTFCAVFFTCDNTHCVDWHNTAFQNSLKLSA